MSNIYAAPSANLSDLAQPGAALAFALNGRIGRLRFVAYSVAAYLLSSLCIIIVLVPLNFVVDAIAWMPAGITLIFFVLYVIIVRRRLQDIGLGGLFSLCIFIRFVNLYFGFMMLFKRGDEGSNEFGPQPPENTIGVKVLAFSFPVLMLIVLSIPAVIRALG